MKYNGQFLILRITKNKKQTFRFEPTAKEFQLILSFLRQQEGEDVNVEC